MKQPSGGSHFSSAASAASASLRSDAQASAGRKLAQSTLKPHSSLSTSLMAISQDLASRKNGAVASGSTMLTLLSKISVQLPQSGSLAASLPASSRTIRRLSGFFRKSLGSGSVSASP